MEQDAGSLSELIAQCADMARRDLLDTLIGRLQPLVAGVVSRTLRRYGIHDAEWVKDLSQDVFLKILSPKFELEERTQDRTDAQILGLIKLTAANMVVDALRASKQFVSIEQGLEICQDENLEVKLLVQEVDATLKKLLTGPNATRDYRIFWFYHRDRMTAREISMLPGVGLTVKGVESLIFRVTADVKKALIDGKGISVKGAF
jgi:DNA-directed RNA polymerase specialized sigma24 family protein